MNSLPRSACTIGAFNVCRRCDHRVVAAFDTGPGEDRDGAGVVEDRRRPLHRLVVGPHHRAGGDDRPRRPRGPVGLLQEHLTGDHHDGDTALLDGRTHRHLEDPRCHLGRADQFAVDAALPEQVLRVRLLEVLRADLGAWDVRRDRQHRHPAALCVEKAVDQVQVAGPAAARADREAVGQRGVGGRCECGRLLVTHMLPRRFRELAGSRR